MEEQLTEKPVIYRDADPNYLISIRDALFVEQQAFKSYDPVEQAWALKQIATYGLLLLQYIKTNSSTSPNGVIELYPFEWLHSHRPLGGAQKSPFSIAQNSVEMFVGAVNFVEKVLEGDYHDIMFCNGIGVVEQGKGYGTALYREALSRDFLRKKTVVGFVDIAKPDDLGILRLIPNDNSYAMRLNKLHSMVIGVVNPPVVDNSITALTVLRPPYGIPFADVKSESVTFEGDANEALNRVRDLTASGYAGIQYNKVAHEMTFLKLMRASRLIIEL